jgi:hypothetical protein
MDDGLRHLVALVTCRNKQKAASLAGSDAAPTARLLGLGLPSRRRLVEAADIRGHFGPALLAQMEHVPAVVGVEEQPLRARGGNGSHSAEPHFGHPVTGVDAVSVTRFPARVAV